MRRMVSPVLVLALALASCRGDGGPSPPSTTASTPRGSPSSPTPGSPTPTVTSSPVALPEGLPTAFDQALPASAVPTQALVPIGSEVTGAWYAPAAAGIGEQIVVSWADGDDPFRRAHGLAIWQSFPGEPPWRPVYGFVERAGLGILGIRIDLGDLTADGHVDALVIEDMGGSGVCATWRVLAVQGGPPAQIYERQACDTDIAIAGDTLVVTESVYREGDPHCCPSATRGTTLRWDGLAWQVVDEIVTES